jgi:hypothetical protein
VTSDLEDDLRRAGERLRTQLPDAAIPPVARVHAGARRRRRTRRVSASAVVVLLLVASAMAAARIGDHEGTDVSTDPTTRLSQSRLLPEDTIGTTLEFAIGGPVEGDPMVERIPAELRATAIALWRRDGEVVLGIRSSGDGALGGESGSTQEHVDVDGWPDATLQTRADGSLSLALWDGRQIHELATGDLGRDALIELGGHVVSRSDGLGAQIPADALPSDYVPQPVQYSASDWAVLVYNRTSEPFRSLTVSLRTCSDACLEMERLRQPATASVDVDGVAADVLQFDQGTSARVRFMPRPGVLVFVDVRANRDENVDLALQVARSLRTVDQETWDAALATRPPDDDGGKSTDTTAVAPVTSTATPR